MDLETKKELKFLKRYVIVITVLFLALISFAFSDHMKYFDEITVERINVVDSNGQIRMVISNEDRFPDPVIGGEQVDLRQGPSDPGIIFYNDEGDECGGLLYGVHEVEGKKVAGTSLLFDQYQQDQVLQLMYFDVEQAQSTIGLQVNDRPEDVTINEMVDMYMDIQSMDEENKTQKMKEMQQRAASGEFGSERLFVGTINDQPILSLKDKAGTPKIKIYVDKKGEPVLEFLDDNGDVTFSLPEK